MTKHTPHRPDLETLHARLLMYKLSAAEIDPLFTYVSALEDHVAELRDELYRVAPRCDELGPATSGCTDTPRGSLPAMEIAARAELLAGQFAADDRALAASDTHEVVPWRVVEATGSTYRQRPARFYITCIPADHPCWQPQPLTAYSGLGIWTQDGATTREYANAITRLRNNAGAAAEVIHLLLHELRGGGYKKVGSGG